MNTNDDDDANDINDNINDKNNDLNSVMWFGRAQFRCIRYICKNLNIVWIYR